MRTLKLTALLTLLAACAGEASDTDGNYGLPGLQDSGLADSADTGEVYVEPVFAPQEGTWSVTASELALDECGLTDMVNRGEPGSVMELTHRGDLLVSMIFEGGGETVNCEIDEAQGFSCDRTESIDTTARDNNLKADIPVVINSSGSFVDESNMSLSSTVDIDCTGQDCGLIEILLGTKFPCAMTMNSDLVVQ